MKHMASTRSRGLRGREADLLALPTVVTPFIRRVLFAVICVAVQKSAAVPTARKLRVVSFPLLRSFVVFGLDIGTSMASLLAQINANVRRTSACQVILQQP
jgi:hypothetical protein